MRAAFQERIEGLPHGAGDSLRQASYPVVGHRYPWKVPAVGALAAMAGLGAYLGVSSGAPTSAPRPLHTETVAFVGSSPTLAVTALPPGFSLSSSSQLSGPSSWFTGSNYTARSFSNAAGQVINVQEIVGGSATPKAVGLASAYPQAVTHVSVAGKDGMLLDLASINNTQGYYLYWQVSPDSFAAVAAPSASQAELVADAVAPVTPAS
ncbi:MAG: hypothetical protein ACRDWV_05175 [Acidimicrobiales bacterium]